MIDVIIKMDDEQLRQQKMKNRIPFHEYGFWWWYDPEIKDWRIGCAPSIGLPKWWNMAHEDPRKK